MLNSMNMTTFSAVSAPAGFCQRCPTRNHCVAAELEPAELNQLSRIMNLGRTLPKGAHAFVTGEPVQNEYHVRSGVLKTYFTNSEGVECITGFYLPGEVVPSFNRNGYHTHSALALTDATVCIEHTQAGHPITPELERLRFLIGNRGQQTTSRVLHQQINLHATSAQARFAGFCTDMMDRLQSLKRTPSYIPTPMSRTDIASFLGITLESLSRVISTLKRSGVITADRQGIDILQPEAVRSMAAHLC